MIPFEKAFEIVMGQARILESEEVDLRDSLNRVLAEDVVSDIDMPPFDKSAMDGYACRRADTANDLDVAEVVQAGYLPTKRIGPNECAKIMTGAMIPDGADCVVMIEYTERTADNKVRFTGEGTRDNICRKSEDIRAGDVVLRRGARIAPQHIAVLATVGCARPRVIRRPRVGVIATGDELVEPHEKPGPSQIRTSNSYQLCAQVESTGAVPTYCGIAPDTEEAIDCVLKDAIAANDVVLLSGGVSTGDYDFVPAVMAKNNIRILFDSVAAKPGKPTTFGVSPEVYCFGLPGNPVSTFIQFEILVRPFLYALMGHAFRAPHLIMPVGRTIRKRKSDREAWIPVTITPEGRIVEADFHGSAHINGLCQADGLIVVPIGVTVLEEGALVRVRPI